MGVLFWKLCRDLRVPLAIVALLLGGFQCLFVKISQRVVTEISPAFGTLTRMAQKYSAFISDDVIQRLLFNGPGRIMQTLAGGEHMQFEKAMHMLSIGYVHPLMQTIFCIWAIGRASGAIAGEIDKGTMELLMAQPIARYRVVLAHLCVDLLTIPLLCLSLWFGSWLGAQLVGPFEVDLNRFKDLSLPVEAPPAEDMQVHVAAFGPGLWNIGALIFAVCGYTMWLSAAGRFHWRVMGLSVLITLLQFLVNLLGQLWDVMEPLRPFTIFYYFQPQKIILQQQHAWTVDLRMWNGGQPLAQVPVLAVLLGVGFLGYLMALRTFTRRDLPAPL
ncbi:MAG TPA: ABC transporter permease subunit [Gemmataceae bacterium]|jgi:ABC-2 type transport system permease protein